ncbi:hypothetical protein ABTY00_24350 [Streptomyces microflavus]
MAQEWTDPRYADMVAAWKTGQEPDSRDPEPRPVRGFVIPAEPEA